MTREQTFGNKTTTMVPMLCCVRMHNSPERNRIAKEKGGRVFRNYVFLHYNDLKITLSTA